jgi:flagellin
MRLTHNLASLNIYREHSKVLQKQSQAMGRISSGYKVSKTKDDPDGLATSERLRMQIRGTQMAARNVQDGISMLQTAEGALGNVNEMLVRIRELAVKAGSDTNSPEDKAIIQKEIDQMLKGIDDIANNTEFNGNKLLAYESDSLDPANDKLFMPTGANVNEKVEIPRFDIRSDKLKDSSGKTLALIDVTTSSGANDAIETIDDITEKVLSINSKFGALENRFESSYESLVELSDRTQGAESSIRDADIAEEMLELSKSNILIEAGNALMVQTNRFPQEILRILENMRK